METMNENTQNDIQADENLEDQAAEAEETTETENADPPSAEPSQEEPKTRAYTQEQLDAIIRRKISKATRGMIEASELEKAQQEHEATKVQLQNALAELENLRRINFFMGKGCATDEAEFLAYKTTKSMAEGEDFQAAAERIIKTYQPSKKKDSGVVVSTGGSFEGKGVKRRPTTSEEMNALIRQRRY